MAGDYLLAGRGSELERLQLQSRVWEPAGRALLARLGQGAGLRALDVGCGAMGWLRLLSQWVGEAGGVVGTDVDASLLDAARELVDGEQLRNVMLVEDDLFASRLVRHSFDVVHARFQLAPLGRMAQQVAAYVELLAAGGTLVLEEPDASSWHFNPPAPASQRLIDLILNAFAAAGGCFDAGRRLPELLMHHGMHCELDAQVLALTPLHPYLRLPLQFAAALEARLLALISRAELDDLRAEVEVELSDPQRWGTTFTLIQVHATVAGAAAPAAAGMR